MWFLLVLAADRTHPIWAWNRLALFWMTRVAFQSMDASKRLCQGTFKGLANGALVVANFFVLDFCFSIYAIGDVIHGPMLAHKGSILLFILFDSICHFGLHLNFACTFVQPKTKVSSVLKD